jgi:hypothetical protein
MRLSIKILFVLALAFTSYATVTVNTITGLTTSNLVYSGTISISATNNLFFTYYGVDGETDQSKLKNSPLLIVVGR